MAQGVNPQSANRASLDLSGEWEFQVDPLDVGRSEKWFEIDKPFERKIKVPGAWNAQGVAFDSEEQLRSYETKFLNGRHVMGPERESEKLFHVYPGPAWYRKTITIPQQWKGLIPWLILHGVHREAEVWINGQTAGLHRSYLTPFHVDLSGLADPGDEITIVIRVDARRNAELDPLMGCLDTLDFLYVSWGGLYRKVTLEATPPVRIEDIFIVPHLDPDGAEVRVAIAGSQSGSLEIETEICDSSGAKVATDKKAVDASSTTTVCTVNLPNAKRWSPRTPHLYTTRVRLLADGKQVDAHSVRFGMREFKIADGKFRLNGEPIFLRGYGDDCIFPNTISPPADKSEFRRRLTTARDYGFNYVRHHSWCPPEEYFDIADELGMILQPEFPFAYRMYLPATPQARQSAAEQWKQMVRLHRNHPSIVTWCMGNELYGSFEGAEEMYAAAKTLDPTRLVINSDGVSWDENNRATLDFLVVPFAEDNSIGFNDGKYTIPKGITKPVIAHEIGYFVTLPDMKQIELFKSGVRPYWLFDTRDIATRKRILQKYPEWLDASYKLQSVCLKTNLEAARRSNLCGTSVWLFQDYPNCAEGVVDMFYRQKGISAAEFRRFNSPTVLLLDAPRRNWRAGETAELKLLASRYEDQPSTGALLQWKLKSPNGDTVVRGEAKVDVGNHGVQELHSINFRLPENDIAERLTLSCEVKDSNGKSENSWDMWVFPRTDSAVTAKNVCFSSGTAALRAMYPDASEETTVSGRTDLLITKDLDEPTRNYLKNGGRVLLVDPESAFHIEKTNFRLSSWDGGGPSGTILDKEHPLLRGMPSEGWCDLQFYHLIQGSKTVFLERLSREISPIVRCIDRPNRLADRAYLFEVAVGKGKLLVSGFNFPGALESKDPVGEFIFNRLIRYALSHEFQPKTVLPREILAAR